MLKLTDLILILLTWEITCWSLGHSYSAEALVKKYQEAGNVRLDPVTSSASSHGSCLLGKGTSPHCLQRLSRSVGWLHPTFGCFLVSWTYCIGGHQCTGSLLALERKGSGFTVVFSMGEKRLHSKAWEVKWEVRRLLGTVPLPEDW